MSNATTQPAAAQVDIESIPPELREKIAEYIGATDQVIEDQKVQINELTEKVAGLEKSAADPCKGCGGKVEDGKCSKCGDMYKTASLEQGVVDATLDKIVQAGFLKEGNRQQALQAISEDPAGALLDFIDKLATNRIETVNAGQAEMPKLGHAVPTGQESASAPEVRESDQAFETVFDNLGAPKV